MARGSRRSSHRHRLLTPTIRDRCPTVIGRYETTLERGLYRALHELQRLQATRLGRDVAPPAVVDIQVSSGQP